MLNQQDYQNILVLIANTQIPVKDSIGVAVLVQKLESLANPKPETKKKDDKKD